jgi:hypothetical protein
LLDLSMFVKQYSMGIVKVEVALHTLETS